MTVAVASQSLGRRRRPHEKWRREQEAIVKECASARYCDRPRRRFAPPNPVEGGGGKLSLPLLATMASLLAVVLPFFFSPRCFRVYVTRTQKTASEGWLFSVSMLRALSIHFPRRVFTAGGEYELSFYTSLCPRAFPEQGDRFFSRKESGSVRFTNST